MKIDALISVVAPLRNNADVVGRFVTAVHAVLREHYTHYELVLVDDGSTDATVGTVGSLLENFEFTRILCLSRQFGEDTAISVGLDSVIGDYVITMRPNTDPPQAIPAMVEVAHSGVDLVQGVREHRRGSTGLYRIGARAFYWYVQRVLKLDIPAGATQFRCMSRRVVNAVAQIRNGRGSLRILMSYIGYSRATFPYQPISGRGREGAAAFRDSVRLAVDTIVGNSPHPLRMVSWLGVFAAMMNVAYAVYIAVIYFAKENVEPGWTTLSMQNAMQFFFISLVLAGIAEYTGRILTRLADRPAYYLGDELNSSVLLRKDQRNIVTSAYEEVDLVAD